MPDMYGRFLFVAIVSAIFYFLVKAYNVRKVTHSLQKQGLPMPPFNWITGHMLALKPFMENFPTFASMYRAVTELALSLEEEAFYLDLWPLSEPLLILTTPAMTSQLTQEFSPPKPSVIKKALARLTGDPGLFDMPGVQCKRWEAIFNTGSSPNFMFQQTSKIVDECRIFCEKMRARAQENQIFSLEEDAVRLALDVIGVVTLDTHFKYQQSTSRITESLRKLIECTSYGTEVNPFKRWNPIRLYNLWHHGRKINRYIETELDKRFLERQSSPNPNPDPKTAKPLITLALDAYLAEAKANTASPYSPYIPTLDPTFKRSARIHLRHLLTTTATRSTPIAHTLHLLSTHPPSHSRLRAEHNRVFGTNTSADPNRVGALLAAVPGLLNHLPYTTACVNEALRLSPAAPASGPRAVSEQKGEKSVVLVGSDGARYPTAGCRVVPLYRNGRRDPAALMHADVFMPERWMPVAATAGTGNALRQAERAWRPGEGGGWDGVGKALVVAEVKILLAMCARAFEFCAVGDGWDCLDLPRGREVGTALGERGVRVGGGCGRAAKRFLSRVTVVVDGKDKSIQ